MVKCSVGVPWWADGHDRKVQVFDRMRRDRGGDGILLPLIIGVAYQNSSSNKPKTNNEYPKDLCGVCLKQIIRIGQTFDLPLQ